MVYIRKYDLNDLSVSPTIFYNAINVSDLFVNNNLLYFGGIFQLDLVSGVSSEYTNLGQSQDPNDFLLENNILYIANGDYETISTINMNGGPSTLTDIVTNIGQIPQAIAIANNYLYISVNYPTKIYRINLNSLNTGLEEVLTLTGLPINAMVTNGNDLYISAGNTVKKLDLNTLSLPNIETENNFKIYPNPTSQFVYISNLKKNNNIKVYDINGRLIINKNNAKRKIDVSELKSGLYFIKIDNIKTEKFIKN